MVGCGGNTAPPLTESTPTTVSETVITKTPTEIIPPTTAGEPTEKETGSIGSQKQTIEPTATAPLTTKKPTEEVKRSETTNTSEEKVAPQIVETVTSITSQHTRPNPSNKKEYIITERTVYRSLGGFLKAELFRALSVGNAPRPCDNCGRYFLSIGQEKTLYCNRVAPNDPKGRLCRKVGAHIKAQKLNEIAFEKAYRRAYDRLKHRKNSGNIDNKTWNKLVSEIQDIRDAAREGKISDAEAIDKLNAY